MNHRTPQRQLSLVLLACISWCAASSHPPQSAPQSARLIAKVYDSGFPLSHDSYNSISAGSDGKIYYVLSSESIDTGAQVYDFDPATKKVEHLGDLTEICGEKGSKAIVQGKIHVNFVENDGKLYFATHVGYYTIRDGMETMGVPPPGYKPYPGGHLLSYDLTTKHFENLGVAPGGEGIIAMSLDRKYGTIFFLTWPTGHFVRFRLSDKSMRDFGTEFGTGEDRKASTYQTICRSIAVDPEDGSAYFTNARGTIFRYDHEQDDVVALKKDNMVKDYFGSYDPASAGSMGYNWRQTIWYRPANLLYGVHGNSGYLFRFDPRQQRVEVLDRITSQPSQVSGMFDEFSYGYLGLTLGPDGKTLHYLTGAPIYRHGERVAGKTSTAKGESKGIEDLHLVTYDLQECVYRDNGPIFFENGDRPTYVNSIAVGKDGTVYALSRVASKPGSRTDIITFDGPLKKK